MFQKGREWKKSLPFLSISSKLYLKRKECAKYANGSFFNFHFITYNLLISIKENKPQEIKDTVYIKISFNKEIS